MKNLEKKWKTTTKLKHITGLAKALKGFFALVSKYNIAIYVLLFIQFFGSADGIYLI